MQKFKRKEKYSLPFEVTLEENDRFLWHCWGNLKLGFYLCRGCNSYKPSRACMLSHSVIIWLCCDPWSLARQSLLSMRFPNKRILKWVPLSFSRRSFWPGTKHASPALAREYFTTEAPLGILPALIDKKHVVLYLCHQLLLRYFFQNYKPFKHFNNTIINTLLASSYILYNTFIYIFSLGT